MITKDVDTATLERRLDELLKRGSSRKPTKQSKVKKELEPLINKISLMVENKFTYKEIAEELREGGISASVETIRRQIISLIENQSKQKIRGQRKDAVSVKKTPTAKDDILATISDTKENSISDEGRDLQKHDIEAVSIKLPAQSQNAKRKMRKHAGLDEGC